MRLTLDIIGAAEQRVGPTKERIISLRGLKIPTIENLGATNNHFDIIDLTDNDLIKLDNFPPLNRLQCLLVANNRVTRLDADVLHNLPSLKSFILTNNKLNALSDLAPLFKAKCLERLCLIDNPVASCPHYRPYLIFGIPTLRFIDFKRVTDAERIEAKRLFSGPAGIERLAQLTGELKDTPASTPSTKTDLLGLSNKQHDETLEVDTIQQNHDGHLTANNSSRLSPDEIASLQDEIASATSLSEVQRLEQALMTGILPSDLKAKLIQGTAHDQHDITMDQAN